MSNEQDREILKITKGLCQLLDITNYNPTSVTWQAVILRIVRGTRRYLVLPYDQCILLKEGLVLPAAMQEKLELDEWTPIIASALVYQKVFGRRRRWARALIILSYLLLAAVLLPLLRLVFLTMAALVWVYLLLAMIFGFVFGWQRYLKGLRAQADREAANIVGTPKFVGVLEKISDLDPTDKGKTHSRRGVGAVWPLFTIQQRISNLRTYPAES